MAAPEKDDGKAAPTPVLPTEEPKAAAAPEQGQVDKLPATTAAAAVTSKDSKARNYKVVYAGGVNVRVAPTGTADQVGERDFGDAVEVIEVRGDWARLLAPSGIKGER